MPRDWSKPLTEAELENLKTVFRSMPSYKTGGHIESKDIIKMCEAVDYPRTPDQLSAYKDYLDKRCGGIITLDDYMETAKAIHSISAVARKRAIYYDKDGNGFISADEFDELMELLSTHDPSLPNITYAEFVKQADTDKDGRISIDECGKWIESHTLS